MLTNTSVVVFECVSGTAIALESSICVATHVFAVVSILITLINICKAHNGSSQKLKTLSWVRIRVKRRLNATVHFWRWWLSSHIANGSGGLGFNSRKSEIGHSVVTATMFLWSCVVQALSCRDGSCLIERSRRGARGPWPPNPSWIKARILVIMINTCHCVIVSLLGF